MIPQYDNNGNVIGYLDPATGIVTSLSGKPADSGPVGSTIDPSLVTPWRAGSTNNGSANYVNVIGGDVGALGNVAKGIPVVGGALGGGLTGAGNLISQAGSDPGAVAGAIPGVLQTVANKGANLLGGNITGSGAPTDATSALHAALANASQIGNNAGTLAANYQSVAAPTIAAPGPITAATAAYGAPVQAGTASATMAQYQAAIQAQQVQAAQIAAVERAQAATVGATKVGPTALSNAAQIDTGPEAQMRAQQLALAGQYQDYIAGKEPSAAGIMLRQATDRNVANQYALAASANGMNTGLAQRSAMINAANLNGDAAASQAILRAQEIAQARGALSNIYDSTRGADIGVATNQAGLQQQTNLANQSATNTSTLTQAQIDAARAQEQAQLTTGVSQFNAGQNNTRAIDQAQLSQAASLANQQANLSASTTNASLANQVALANAQYGTQASIANANNVTSANSTSAQLANAISLANANNQTQANLTGAQLNTQVGIANGNNQVSTNALNQKAVNDLYGNQLTASGQQITGASNQADYYAKLAAAQAQKQASLVGAAGAVGAALL